MGALEAGVEEAGEEVCSEGLGGAGWGFSREGVVEGRGGGFERVRTGGSLGRTIWRARRAKSAT